MSETTKRCPFCDEEISVNAIKCKHCGSMLPTPPTAPYDTLDLKLTGTPGSAGRRLADRYSVIKELGRGGMGVVYLAHDDELDMDVAVKLLPVEMANDRRALEQLHSEAKLSMSLAHPNIMRLHTLDTSGQFKFLVMEYVDGPDLLDMLREKEKLPLDEALPIIKAICEGLDYAHSKRMLHRDLKPANIMVNSKGEVKITDFGIARQMRESMSMISQKTISGTPAYMAPEHIMGEHLTVRSDIYSLGAVVYELLSGHPPFYQGDILAQIRFKEPPSIPGIPEHFNAAILKALTKSADDRPESAAAFYKSLTDATLKVPPKPQPTPKTPVKAPKPPPSPAPVTTGSTAPESAVKEPLPRKKKSLVFLIAILCLVAVIAVLAPVLISRLGGASQAEHLAYEERQRKLREAQAEYLAQQEEERKQREAEATEKARKDAEAKRLAEEEASRRQREEAESKKKEEDFRRLLMAAENALEEKRYGDAIANASEALKMKPEDSHAKILIEQARTAQTVPLQDLQNLLLEALLALRHKCYDDAIAKAEEAQKIRPEDETARNILVKARTEKAVEEENQKRFDQLLKTASDLLRAGRYEESIRTVGDALALKPGDSAASGILKKAQEEKAERKLRESQEARFVELIRMAQKAVAEKRYRDAIALYQMALAIMDSKEARDLLQRAQSLLAQKEEKARKEKEKMSTEELKQAHGQAQQHLRAQEYDKALKVYKKIIESYPEDLTANYNTACLLSLDKKIEKALDYLEKSIKIAHKLKTGGTPEEQQNAQQILELLKTDTDIDNLRETDRFKKIVGGHE